jgi:fibronectin type 3 domain-containing protein
MVTACGSGGQQSAANATLVCAPGTTSPSTHTAVLSWEAPPGTVQGYRVYCGTSSGAYAQALGSGAYTATTSFVVTGLPSGQTYFFAVTAIDASGLDSGYSNEASKTFP